MHSSPRFGTRFRAFFSFIAVVLTPVGGIPGRSFAREAPSDTPLEARAKLSADLLEAIDDASFKTDSIPVIVQARTRRSANTESRTHAGALQLPLVGGFAVRLSKDAVVELASHGAVRRITLDREVATSQATTLEYNHLRTTTGGSQVIGATGITPRNGQFGPYLDSLPGGMPSGAGVSIAVLDSGIYDDSTRQADLRNLNQTTKERVLVHKDFCSIDPAASSGVGYDPYGHGTHVAAIAAGNGRESLSNELQVNNEWSGMALGANLVDVRVVAGDGRGLTSDVIRGLQWTVANKDTYNIRVANLSLGAPIRESFRTDPLCQAVQAAIDAGIVCVVAAGNYGKTDTGETVYGGIMSPGNLPDAITVGAAKTFGTNRRSDDVVASFSSRGPTLVDGAAKPDLIAPGDHLVAAAAKGNILETTYPWLVVYRKALGPSNYEDVYMQMSGTSVAAPIVERNRRPDAAIESESSASIRKGDPPLHRTAAST